MFADQDDRLDNIESTLLDFGDRISTLEGTTDLLSGRVNVLENTDATIQENMDDLEVTVEGKILPEHNIYQGTGQRSQKIE